MRERVRLSGRQQIVRSAFSFAFKEENGIPVEFTLSLSGDSFINFPADSNVRIRLIESSHVETISFGVLDMLRQGSVIKEFENTNFFVNPSCELRISRVSGDSAGKILGSTEKWKLRSSEGEGRDAGMRGILAFACGNTDPLPWNLEFAEDSHPVLRLDKKILQSSIWAVRDPVFSTCVLPAVVQIVLRKILDSHLEGWQEQKWIQDWLVWAEQIRPGVFDGRNSGMPVIFDDGFEQDGWILDMAGEFCRNQKSLERLIGSLDKMEDSGS